ncbi:M48 family metallopeptidase [Castellaniella sp.]|uniref:M48 family metallopeptidase n=1 Tax=Castellaniella sp. TaxID=1955812 RepID=UPI003C73872F
MPIGKPRQLSLFDGSSPGTAAPGPTPAAGLPPATPEPPGYTRHEIHLQDQPLAYRLRRSRRKTIGLTIRDARLLIQAPTWATRRQIEEVIQEKSRWIRDKMRINQERMALLALQDTQWRPGGRIPYLGVMIELRLDGSREARFEGDPRHPRDCDLLFLPLPDGADGGRIQERAQAWLQEQARQDFDTRLQRSLALAEQQIHGWALSAAQGRWGSCTSQRRIRLNWRLIHLPPSLIDYVVAHEVAHLKEMNHSPAFWREVERLCPDFKAARDALARHHPTSLPLF